MTEETMNSQQKDGNSPSNALENFSLLWPPGKLADRESGRSTLGPAALRDLDLVEIIRFFSEDARRQEDIEKTLATLIQDPEVIRYRQEVVEDLLRHPQLAERLSGMLPVIDALGRQAFRSMDEMTTLHEVTWRLGELQSLVESIQALSEAFQETSGQLISEGFRYLQDEVSRVRENETFQHLRAELPGLLVLVRTSASVTIGVNLDQFLRPVQATLLSVNEEPFTNQSLLNQLFGKRSDQEGIAPLHTVPKRESGGPYALPVDPELGWAVEPLMVPLFEDLAHVLEKVTKPIARQLKRYVEFNSRMFVHLRQDLIFYLGALRFIRTMQEVGLPMCRPEIAPMEERLCQVDGGFNPNLALRLKRESRDGKLAERIVRNDIRIGSDGRILILTGPNRGGKTTYMQGVGLVQILAQAGLWTPGSRARLSPVDGIYTHFPLEEKLSADTGRFGDESRRLGEIFQQVTRHSLVLLNESFSSTSAGEGLYLAQDVLRILRRLGARAIFSTHLHELAEGLDALNGSTPGDSKIASLVSSPVEDGTPSKDGMQRSYKIKRRPPMGRSYAQAIAARYGISYEQLEKLLAERNVLEPEDE